MAEFAANNHCSTSTQATPFFSNYRSHPRFTITIKPYAKSLASLDAKGFALKMRSLHDFLRSNIRTAQDLLEQAVNAKRKPAPCYQVGDHVYLSAKNIRTSPNSQKLDWRKLGPYPIKEVVSPYAYRLQLSKTMKIHPVFHVCLLEPSANEPVPGQIQPPPPPTIVNNEDEYMVEEICLDSITFRTKGNCPYFSSITIDSL